MTIRNLNMIDPGIKPFEVPIYNIEIFSFPSHYHYGKFISLVKWFYLTTNSWKEMF